MLSVPPIVEQLSDTTITDWVSDSSMSKTAHGSLSKVSKSKNGLQLDLSTGKKVNWRMPENIANEVIESLKWIQDVCNVAQSIYTDEIGVEEIYDDRFTDEELWLQKNNW
jgi:hypothetical protein